MRCLCRESASRCARGRRNFATAICPNYAVTLPARGKDHCMRIRHHVMTLAGAVLALAAVLGGAPALAQVEGTNYSVLSPAQPTQSPGKIEVVEFFSYACPHCAEFYPLVSTWLAMQPKDVAFRRVPVGFERPPWINLQRAYFALLA